MKYSKATNYALHSMAYLIALPKENAVNVEQLANFQALSPTYLSKILTKLVKANLIESTPGVKGGYRIIGDRNTISFLDVIQAIEGQSSLFHCSLEHESKNNTGCLIEAVMDEAEENMKNELKNRYLIDIAKKLDAKKVYQPDC